MVLEMDLSDYVMVSSFVPEIVEEMRLVLEEKHEFMLNALGNRRNEAMESYSVPVGTDGLNVSYNFLTEELVKEVHE